MLSLLSQAGYCVWALPERPNDAGGEHVSKEWKGGWVPRALLRLLEHRRRMNEGAVACNAKNKRNDSTQKQLKGGRSRREEVEGLDSLRRSTSLSLSQKGTPAWLD